ncbi:ribosomal large subunit pseudouridine synthase C [Bartonella schoenbuchensis R1]|uniref:Pseudouridine synthase n=3 Tax=Bartonella schoenbuchensis TaxID=165694 RepID=E6YZV3_BARSR|nr:ribosomal large subunit pseudouridine synthase C [Bartonella schoenbuchensis R1]CBI82391.1 ribosomal large subunit pseudouridine synthase C [Bartonella schoenbuchensis R1]CDP80217.1 ribosomal large subunit pseudouridine synthase C [Bartonella schoenbuchensis]
MGVEIKKVEEGESGMRLDRWFKVHYPGLAFGYLQKLLRSGQIRVDGRRVKTDIRLIVGQSIRVPFLSVDNKKNLSVTDKTIHDQAKLAILEKMLLYKDPKIFVLNKPAGLAVQGGSGLTCHIDGMLEVWRNKKGEKPRLVHRLDRETSGVLIIARSRGAAQALTAAFRARETKKTYWALVRGVPRKKQDKISTWMVKETTAQGDKMRVCEHGEPDSNHAVSYYRVLDTRGRALSWLEMEPYTGRTHQLRVHAAYMDHPIIGDSKYFFSDNNWELPGGIQNRLHLHARRIRIPHPSGGILDIIAPLPPHMVQSFNLLAFNENDGDTE